MLSAFSNLFPARLRLRCLLDGGLVGFVDEGAVDILTVFSFSSLPFVAKLGLFEH